MRFSLEASVPRSVPGALEEYAHSFEAKALILAGEMRIRVGNDERPYRVGDVFMSVTNPGAELRVIDVDAARFLEPCRRPSFGVPSEPAESGRRDSFDCLQRTCIQRRREVAQLPLWIELRPFVANRSMSFDRPMSLKAVATALPIYSDK
jgi:hypothetical protein